LLISSKKKSVPNFSSAKIQQCNSPPAAQSHLILRSSLLTGPSDFVSNLFKSYSERNVSMT